MEKLPLDKVSKYNSSITIDDKSIRLQTDYCWHNKKIPFCLIFP